MNMASANPNETPLPRAVQAQVKRVNLRLEAIAAGKVVPTQPAPGAADETPAVVTEPEPTATATPPAADARENDPAYWRQRFNVTAGMLRTLQQQVRESDTAKDRELTELRERIRALEVEKPASDSSAPEVATLFTPEQIERYGEDQCQAIATAAFKAARTEATKLLDAAIKPIQQRTEATANADKQAKVDAFWEKLTELMPDWEEINAQPEWLTWLAEPDHSTGLVRQDILDRHRGALNAAGVAQVFSNFKKRKNVPVPNVTPKGGAAGGQNDAQTANVPALGYPSPQETKDYYKKAKLGKVTDKERMEFEARLKLKAAA